MGQDQVLDSASFERQGNIVQIKRESTSRGYSEYHSHSPNKYTLSGQQDRGMSCSPKKKKCIWIFLVLLAITLIPVAYILGAHSNSNTSCLNPIANEAIEEQNISANITSSCLMISPDIPLNLTGDHLNIDLNVTEEAEVVSTISLQTEADKTDALDVFRLPNNLSPQKYRIKIIPLFYMDNNLTTIGEVTIQFLCLNATNEIILNAKGLSIEDTVKVSLYGSNMLLQVLRIEHDDKNERFSVILEKPLSENRKYNIHIKFHGKISNTENGVYRSSFIEPESKEQRWVLSTLFSPSDARQAYPSFDEPAFKAQFTFSIARPTGYISLSNMNIKDVQPVENMGSMFWDNYHETPPMSTYLTAFVVAPFNSLPDLKYITHKSRPIINGYARPNALSQIAYAIDLAPKIVKVLEDLFGMDYPLPKLDIVAVPSQFYDAMENWGLIIFRESSLLVMPNSTEKIKQSTALILAHEICHQWLGNLITPKWWDHVWLKEGLSTYFQYVAIDKIFPEWHIFDHFVKNEVEIAFTTDALLSSHALSNPINKPTKDLFDVINYHKGSSIVRMMSKFIGESTMYSAISSMLKKFAFENFNQDDLWEELYATISDIQYDRKSVDIKIVMDSWTLQEGYPIVTFNRDYDNGNVVIAQERFFVSDKSDIKSLWWIPISFTMRTEQRNRKFWFNATSATYIQNIPIGNLYLLGNVDNSGFYRVNYDEQNWRLLIESYRNLDSSTRGQLLSDSFHMARSGKLEYNIALSMASQLSSDLDYNPWEAVSSSFHYLRNALINMPGYGDLRTFIVTIMQRVYGSIKFDNILNSEMPQQHMTNILSMACLFKQQHCVNYAVQEFRRFLISSEERYLAPESTREIVYCTAASNGGRAEWEYLYTEYRRAILTGQVNRDEQQRLARAMGCTSESWLLTKSLGLILQHDSYLTTEDGILLFMSVSNNNIGHRTAVNFIREKWRDLLEYYGIPTIIYKMVYSTITYINTPYELQELKKLISEIKKVTMEESVILDQAIEIAENNIKWMAKNYPVVTQWVQEFNIDFGLVAKKAE